jgi:ribonuclease HI
MEITAAMAAVKDNTGPLEILSDSTYVVHCFRDEWWKGWLKRNWKNSQRKPVANRDLWEPFIEEVLDRDVTFTWVKAHAGDYWNEMADQLAVEAGYLQSARSGDQIPKDIASP